jgi:hypothetical protein
MENMAPFLLILSVFLSRELHFFQYFFTEVTGTCRKQFCLFFWLPRAVKVSAHRYHAVPSPGFEPTTLWLRVRRPNHSPQSAICNLGNFYQDVQSMYLILLPPFMPFRHRPSVRTTLQVGQNHGDMQRIFTANWTGILR